MFKRIGIVGLSLVVMVLILLGFQSQAQASSIDSSVSGLDAPSKIEEETGDNTYTEVTDKTAPLLSGQNYKLTYSWTVADGTSISDGDTATVTLPDSAGHGRVGFSVTTGDQTATKVGDFVLAAGDGHTGTITFNDALANANTYHQGSLTFNVTGTSGEATSGGSDYVVAKNGWIQTNDYDSAGIPTQAVWQIVFNPDAKDMGTVTLTDTLGAYQSYVADSLVATDETTGEKVTPTVVVSGSKVTITFTNVTHKISLYYYAKVDTTAFSGQTTGYLSNNVDLATDDGETGSAGTGSGSGSTPGTPTTTAEAYKNVQWGGTATMGGDYIGSVTLTKTAADKTTTLAGAEYTLQKLDPDTGMYEDIQENLTTTSAGTISDYGLVAGDYQFIETKAPAGYQLNKTPVAFTISSSNATSHQTVTQADTQGAVTLTKTDAASKDKLANAQYELAYGDGWGTDHASGAPVSDAVYTTGDDGTFTVTGLAPGNYEFIEEQAPTGYILDQTPVTFTIGDTETAENVSVGQTDVFGSESSSSSSTTTSSLTSSSTSSSEPSSEPSSETTSSSSSEPSSEPSSESTSSSSSEPSSEPSSETTSSSSSSSETSSEPSSEITSSSPSISSSSSTPIDSSSQSDSSSSQSTSSSSSGKPSNSVSTSSSSSSSHSSSSSSDSLSSGSDGDRVNTSSDSSSTISNGTKITTTPSQSSSTSGAATVSSGSPATVSGKNTILPQTNEGRGVLAMVVGLVLLGIGASVWQWRRSREN